MFFSVIFLAGCNKQDDLEGQEDLIIHSSGDGETKEGMTMEDEMEMKDATMEYIDVSPEEAKKMVDENPELIVIDVSPKYDEGHLPGAINYYVGDGSLDKAIPGLDENATYLVYCHVDSASILGSQKLIDAGFKNVYRLEGNYNAWVDAGYPVEK